MSSRPSIVHVHSLARVCNPPPASATAACPPPDSARGNLHEADEAICIPMDPAARAAGVDSLNVVAAVVAAAAIACHHLTTRNR